MVKLEQGPRRTARQADLCAATSTRWARRAAVGSRWWRWTCGHIGSVREHTEALIAFDRFHVAQHLGAAVDQVRRSENRALRQQDDDRLVKTRYLWLTRRGNMTQRQRRAFTPLRRSSLRVARAWAIKELATRLWDYRSRGWAVRMWRRWYGWAIRSRLEPIKKVARMISRCSGDISSSARSTSKTTAIRRRVLVSVSPPCRMIEITVLGRSPALVANSFCVHPRSRRIAAMVAPHLVDGTPALYA